MELARPRFALCAAKRWRLAFTHSIAARRSSLVMRSKVLKSCADLRPVEGGNHVPHPFCLRRYAIPQSTVSMGQDLQKPWAVPCKPAFRSSRLGLNTLSSSTT